VNAFELKIPPPVVALFIAVAMWGISLTDGPFEVPTPTRGAVAFVFALIGGCIGIAGVVALRRAKTTTHPANPENTSRLITSGVYRFTRNPMYAGVFLILAAWAVLLVSAWALTGPVIFVLYVNRFQIAPEERVLETMFGSAYLAYKANVHRWL
jgi:protein-S-isoprenylcysteine O-methyltransferase Ste14